MRPQECFNVCWRNFVGMTSWEPFQPGKCLSLGRTMQTSCVLIGLVSLWGRSDDVRRACWCRDAMLAALSAGRTLVVDRYAYSGAAFTAAKGIAGLDLAWCKVKPSPGTHLQPAWTVSAL